MALFTLHHGAERQGDSQARMETSHTISQSVAMRRLGGDFEEKYLTVCLKQMLFKKKHFKYMSDVVPLSHFLPRQLA